MFENKKVDLNSNRPDASPVTTEVAESEPSIRKKVGDQLKRLIRRERDLADPFNEILDVLDAAEKRSQREIEEDLKRLYEVWACSFDLLKEQFFKVFALFQDIEDLVEGWYTVSPNLGQWGPVGHDTNGYTFAAGVMKNHSRGAPYAEKSITVTFGMNEYKKGIGTELWLGRQSPISDFLTGLDDCAGKSIEEQYEASRKLFTTLKEYQLQIRLNHKNIGQKTAQIDLAQLEKHSLRSICQNLFVGLNNDILMDLDPLQLPCQSTPLIENLRSA